MFADNATFKIEAIYRIANLCAVSAAGCVAAALSLGIGYLAWQKDEVSTPAAMPKMAAKPWNPPFDAIGTGPLSLTAGLSSGFLAYLSHEVFLAARNTRPDIQSDEACILLGLKSSRQQKDVCNGDKIFLNRTSPDQASGLQPTLVFADQETDIWIKPVVTDRSSVLIEAGFPEEGVEKKSRNQFVLQGGALLGQKSMELLAAEGMGFARSLKQISYWGTDLLMRQYGGEEYSPLCDRHKIEFSDGARSYVCFVSQGDYLTWDEEEWKVSLLDAASPQAPLAYVKAAGPRGVEIEAWDESGFHAFQGKTVSQNPPRLATKIENILTSVRVRTSSQVTCVIGKRRVILKKGDWLLKTSTGWHTLKTSQEIEDCLHHKIKGELFIFDDLEKQGGKCTVKGHLFDEMRTQVQEVSLPIAGDGKTSHSKKKRASLKGGKPL